ncbi:MAG: RNA polymerase sigma factor [Wenzhouxiangellaceae bacterium]
MKRRFENLVDTHGGRLLQLARALLRRNDEAEDVVQETLIKLWHALPEIEPRRELGWLLACTRNACLDLLRRRQRGRAVLHVIAGADTDTRDDADEQPEARITAEQRARQLHAAIAEMPEPGRSLLVLRDIQEVDVATVAELLSLTENQVKVYTFRARRALRRRLEEESDEFAQSEHVA